MEWGVADQLYTREPAFVGALHPVGLRIVRYKSAPWAEALAPHSPLLLR